MADFYDDASSMVSSLDERGASRAASQAQGGSFEHDLEGFEDVLMVFPTSRLDQDDDDDAQSVASSAAGSLTYPTADQFFGTGAGGGSDAMSANSSDGGGGTASSTTSSVLRCPLTLDRMREPVLCLVDSRTYERSAIEQWVSDHGTSPFTREPVSLTQLKPLRLSGYGGEDDDDDADAVSISTVGGWPRVGGGGGGSGGGGGGSGGDRASYLTALLGGGGGVESEQALSLSRPRPFAQRKRWSSSSSDNDAADGGADASAGGGRGGAESGVPAAGLAAAKRGRHDDDGDGDGGIEEWALGEWDFRKGSVARSRSLARGHRTGVYGGGLKGRQRQRFGGGVAGGGVRAPVAAQPGRSGRTMVVMMGGAGGYGAALQPINEEDMMEMDAGVSSPYGGGDFDESDY